MIIERAILKEPKYLSCASANLTCTGKLLFFTGLTNKIEGG
jgi:hypothetical protein